MLMTKLERWLLTRICKRLTIQGYDHKDNVVEYYRMMQEAAGNEFTEDNAPTLNGFLTDCHVEAQNGYYIGKDK